MQKTVIDELHANHSGFEKVCVVCSRCAAFSDSPEGIFVMVEQEAGLYILYSMVTVSLCLCRVLGPLARREGVETRARLGGHAD